MLTLLLAAASVAFAAPAVPVSSMPAPNTGHVAVDIFQDDPSPDKPDWEAARKGQWTKPYIPWTIDAGQGDGVVEFGDVRFRDEVVTGHPDVDVVMTIRVNGVDDYIWVTWDQEVNLFLASQSRDSSYVSSDPSTRIWEDQRGFYLFDHEITNLTVTGLPYSSQTRIEVVWLAVTGTHDSMASHGLTHCVGTDLVIDKSGAVTPFICGGTDLRLVAVGSQLIRPFPSAPEVAPAMPTEEPFDFNEVLRDIIDSNP